MALPMTMRGVVLEEIGPPENLRVEERPVPEPGEGEVLIKVELAGLIFADAEARRGTYFTPTVTPWRPGREAAGTIAAVGPKVNGFSIGQRVAALVLSGACQAEYALASLSMDEAARAPAEILPIPEGVTTGQALAHLTNYRLAHLAFHAWSKATRGDWVLVHGGAGGMGSMLIGVAATEGCQVIASCRNVEERRFCAEAGATSCVSAGSYVEEVKALTNGRGVEVLFNGVGGPTIASDPAVIAPFGELHLYGYAAGKPNVKVFEIKHCLSLKTFSANDFFGTPDFATATTAMFDHLRSGRALDATTIFALEEAAKAHHLLDEGRVIGKIALRP
ncbi:MAG: quinone oxidoreductase family protein [Caulobacteraceae bacterium]